MESFKALLTEIESLPWFDQEFLGNSLLRWVTVLIVLVVVATVLRTLQAIISRRVVRLAQRTATQWDDGLAKTVQATSNKFLLVVAIYCATLGLELPDQLRTIVHSVTIFALLLQAAAWAQVLIDLAVRHYTSARLKDDAAAATTIAAMSFVAKVALWAIVLLLALDNMGIDVTAMVAGLGVGGIAVALAAQNLLGDLFASLSIVLDKPFVLGDFIVVGDYMGNVERIGLKTSRLRSLSGEQLVFANADLLQSRIRNYKQMFERRIVFSLGVTYETPYEKLQAMPGMIREIVSQQEAVRFDRAHFKAYGDFALNFETVYYVLTPEFNRYMDIQQAINLQLFQAFEDAGIEFAYPTQRLLVESSSAG